MRTFDSSGCFFIAAVAFTVFKKQSAQCKKNVKTTVKWLQIAALQKLPAENAIVLFAFANLANHWFLEFLSNLTHYYYGRGNQKNSACQSHQALIENFAAGVDFVSSVHF